jgi:hypothetical protein
MLGMRPDSDEPTVRLDRSDLSPLPDLVIERLHVAGSTVTVKLEGGRCASIELES